MINSLWTFALTTDKPLDTFDKLRVRFRHYWKAKGYPTPVARQMAIDDIKATLD